MSEVTKEQIEEALKTVIDPNTEEDPVTSKTVKNISIDGGKVSVDIVTGYPNKGFAAEYAAMLEEKLKSVEGVSEASANISFKIVAHGVQKELHLQHRPRTVRGPAHEQLLHRRNTLARVGPPAKDAPPIRRAPLEPTIQKRQKQIVLAPKVRIDRPLREPRLLSHLLRRSPVETSTPETLRRRVQQQLPRPPLALLPRQPPSPLSHPTLLSI